MLPNHAPLVVAEQFGTLEALYPGRIDLGLGRAPGGDFQSMRALRRDLQQNGIHRRDNFPFQARSEQCDMVKNPPVVFEVVPRGKKDSPVADRGDLRVELICNRRIERHGTRPVHPDGIRTV